MNSSSKTTINRVLFARVAKQWQKRVSIGCTAFALLACSTAALKPTSIPELDALFDKGRTLELMAATRSWTLPEDQLLRWYEQKGGAGYVPAQLKLADHYASKQNAEMALKWYAKARLGLMLDEEECADRSLPGGVVIGLTSAFQHIEELAKKNDELFLQAIEGALADEARGARLGPKWLCDAEGTNPTGNLAEKSVRERKRAAAREKMVAGQQRLVAERQAREMPVNPSGYPIIELPFPRVRWPVVWVDNERLLVAVEDETKKRPSGWSERTWSIWNVRTGAITPHPVVTDGPICRFRQTYFYKIWQGDDVVYFAGPLGAEKEIRRLTDEQNKKVSVNPHDCQIEERKQRLFIGRLLAHEHGEAGYLESAGKRTFALLPPSPRAPLSFDIGPSASVSHYFEYRDGYVLRYIGDANWGRKVHVLTPEGSLSTTEIPRGAWTDGSWSVAPVRPGLLLWATSIARSGQDISAIYLVVDGRVEKLADGPVTGMILTPTVVSPDGCLAATQGGILVNNRRAGSVVFDVCNSRR